MNEMSQRMMYQGLQMEQYLQLMGTTKEEVLRACKARCNRKNQDKPCS